MRRYRSTWTTWSIACAVVAMVVGDGRAASAETSVAVLGIEPVDVAESLAQQLTDALRQRTAATNGVRMVQGKDLVEMKMIFGCDGETAGCLGQAGKSLGADKLLYGSLKRVGNGKLIAVSLKLLDVKTAVVEKSVNENVPRRDLGAGGLNSAATKWLALLIEVQVNPILEVASEPSNAVVAVDGRLVGRTPLTVRDLAPGRYTLAISATGRSTATRTVDLRAGGTHEVVVTLEPERAVELTPKKPIAPPPSAITEPMLPPLPPPRTSHPGRVGKLFAIGAAAGAVVAGAVAIYTWRSYVSLEETAHADLARVTLSNPPTADETTFKYATPTCSPPATLAGAPGIDRYRADCNNGETYARASTALWVVAGALATAGLVSFVIGDRLDAKAKEARTASQLLRGSLRLSPVFSKQGGGLEASFDF